jgi:histidine triad (HIT) family protein
MDDCKYCQIVENKTNILYEDEKVVAVIPEKPATKGHIQIISKQHHENLQDIEDKDVEQMFYSASFSATALFENLQAQGTNIIANTGGALKKGGHFHIHAIARNPDDGLNFLWQPKKMPEEEMARVQGKIKDKCDMIGVAKKEKEVVDLDKKPEKLESSEEKDSCQCEKPCGKDKGPEAPDSEGKKELPSEEEQRYKKAGEDKKQPEKTGEEKEENYLIKQLRRMP